MCLVVHKPCWIRFAMFQSKIAFEFVFVADRFQDEVFSEWKNKCRRYTKGKNVCEIIEVE